MTGRWRFRRKKSRTRFPYAFSDHGLRFFNGIFHGSHLVALRALVRASPSFALRKPEARPPASSCTRSQVAALRPSRECGKQGRGALKQISHTWSAMEATELLVATCCFPQNQARRFHNTLSPRHVQRLPRVGHESRYVSMLHRGLLRFC